MYRTEWQGPPLGHNIPSKSQGPIKYFEIALELENSDKPKCNKIHDSVISRNVCDKLQDQNMV